MATLFHLSEVLKFAIEKEKESKDLYEHLARDASTTGLKTFFTKLAQEETQHEKFYEKMMSMTSKWSPSQDSEEYDAYMRELIASSRTVPVLSDFTNLKLVLDYAIAREKDSVLFYSGLVDYLSPADREGIYAIIREEVRHVAMLSEMRR